MQKKLIALAIAGLSGAAFAQSNVTIYGVMDASFENAKASGATDNGVAAALAGQEVNAASRSRVNSNSSYIGFKGAESLGNGLTAVFQIETTVTADGGAAAPTVGGAGTSLTSARDTYMGIAGGFGTAAIGYLSTPYRSTMASFDVMPGATGAGASFGVMGRINVGAVLAPLTNGVNTGNDFATAGNNVNIVTRQTAIAYITPTFNGLSGVIAYVPNELKQNAANNTTVVPNTASSLNPDAWNLAINYANGPLKVAYSYLTADDQGVNLGAAATRTGAEKHKAHLFGASYVFGGATTVSGMYENFKGNVGLTAAGAAALGTSNLQADRNAWYVGVKHVMGAHEFAAAYGRANDMKSNRTLAAGATVGDSGASQFSLRYGYNFSKRTQVYGLYSKISNKSNGNYDFGTVGAAAAVGGVAAAPVTAGADPQVMGIGMRHSF